MQGVGVRLNLAALCHRRLLQCLLPPRRHGQIRGLALAPVVGAAQGYGLQGYRVSGMGCRERGVGCGAQGVGYGL